MCGLIIINKFDNLLFLSYTKFNLIKQLILCCMSTRTTKLLGFSVPPVMVKEMEEMAKRERRTKSELFREMFRVYQEKDAIKQKDKEMDWITKLIKEAQAEQVKNPLTAAGMVRQSNRLSAYGSNQAKKLGINTSIKNINKIIHAYRKSRKA